MSWHLEFSEIVILWLVNRIWIGKLVSANLYTGYSESRKEKNHTINTFAYLSYRVKSHAGFLPGEEKIYVKRISARTFFYYICTSFATKFSSALTLLIFFSSLYLPLYIHKWNAKSVPSIVWVLLCSGSIYDWFALLTVCTVNTLI